MVRKGDKRTVGCVSRACIARAGRVTDRIWSTRELGRGVRLGKRVSRARSRVPAGMGSPPGDGTGNRRRVGQSKVLSYWGVCVWKQRLVETPRMNNARGFFLPNFVYFVVVQGLEYLGATTHHGKLLRVVPVPQIIQYSPWSQVRHCLSVQNARQTLFLFS